MRSWLAIVAVMTAVQLVPAPARAELIGAGDLAKIVALARSYGSAEASTDDNGDPMIEGEVEGILYSVFFYGCTGGKACREIQFRASWDTGRSRSIEEMNEWNRTRRFGKAYLDDEGEPVIEMLINLHAGVSHENLDDSFDWWRVVVVSFRDEVIDG